MLIALALMLTGCASTGYNSKSYMPSDFTFVSYDQMAIDVVATLKEVYPPGKTTIGFKKDLTLFDEALESNLRAAGFKIYTLEESTESPLKGVLSLLYTIDHLPEEKGFYMTIRLSDGYVFTRLYEATSSGYVPSVATQNKS